MRKYWWLVALAVSAVVLSGSLAWTSAGDKKKKEQEQEREVTLEQVPAPVKATILKEAGKNKIKEIEEVRQGRKRFYEAAWIKGGREVEIRVAPDGKLLGKEMEEAEDDEDEAEEGEDEDEDKDPGESERKVTEAEVPAAALATLKRLAGRAKITEFAEEIEHGHTFYEGSWKAGKGKMDVLVTPAGDLVEIEEQVGADQVPGAVLAVARKAAGRGAKVGLEKKTMFLYEVKFSRGNRRVEFLLTPDGRRVEEEVEKAKQRDNEEADDDDDEDEDQEADDDDQDEDEDDEADDDEDEDKDDEADDDQDQDEDDEAGDDDEDEDEDEDDDD